MHPAQVAFLNQIKVDKADNSRLVARIKSGLRIFDRGIDVTEERLADALRRLSDATALLKAKNISLM